MVTKRANATRRCVSARWKGLGGAKDNEFAIRVIERSLLEMGKRAVLHEDERNALQCEDSAPTTGTSIVDRDVPSRYCRWLRCPKERRHRLKLGDAPKVGEQLIARRIGDAKRRRRPVQLGQHE